MRERTRKASPLAAAAQAYRAADYAPVDGVARPIERERIINVAAQQAFDTEPGKIVLSWLESITGPLPRGIDDATIRERNAQAWLVSIIKTRMEHGRLGLPRSE